jgi:hypothetical protein
MSWITVAVIGAVGAWFEYSYRRSRRKKTGSETSDTAQPARVVQPGSQPSIVPGDENDKQMNATV